MDTNLRLIYHGKHFNLDPENPEAFGICDRTNFIFNRKDLIKQMEWRGNRLVWTGLYVGRPYLDTPNPQLRAPNIPPDPVPIREPRPMKTTICTWSDNTLPVWSEIKQTWASLWTVDSGNIALPYAEAQAEIENMGWGQ